MDGLLPGLRLAVLAMFPGCGFQVSLPDLDIADASYDANHDAPDAGLPACPVDFVLVPGAPSTSRYRIFAQGRNYTGAVAACSSLGAHLLRLDTQAEADALEAAIDAVTTGGDTHLYRVVGQRDRAPTPDVWFDLDGVTPLAFLPWGQGEPTSGGGEDCIALRTEVGIPTLRVIGADQCTTLHEYACECE